MTEERYKKLLCVRYGYACTECETIVVPDPYNPNYIICDCTSIGQVDPLSNDRPKSWKEAEIKAYI